MTMTARTVVAQAAAAQRKKNKEEKNKNSDIGKKGNWQKRTWNFFAAVVSELKTNVGFEESVGNTNSMLGHGQNSLVDHALTPQRIHTIILTCWVKALVRMELLLQRRKFKNSPERILLFQVFWYGHQSCDGLTCTQKVGPSVPGIVDVLVV